jgi:hypothetical protein
MVAQPLSFYQNSVINEATEPELDYQREGYLAAKRFAEYLIDPEPEPEPCFCEVLALKRNEVIDISDIDRERHLPIVAAKSAWYLHENGSCTDCQCSACCRLRDDRKNALWSGPCLCSIPGDNSCGDYYQHQAGRCMSGCTCSDCEAKRQARNEAERTAWEMTAAELDVISRDIDDRGRDPVMRFAAQDLFVLKRKQEAAQNASRVAEFWASPEGRAETARRQAEQEEENRKRAEEQKAWAAQREEMRREGPDRGPVAVRGDPAETYRRMITWASSGEPDDRTKYGRLFLVKLSGKLVGGKTEEDRDAGVEALFLGAPTLCEMVSNEDCTDHWVHADFRRRDPSYQVLPRYCNGSCNSTFSLRPIKSLAQLDAYLVREDIRAYQLDDDYNVWFSPDIDEEAKRLVWESQHWPGCWKLRACLATRKG